MRKLNKAIAAVAGMAVVIVTSVASATTWYVQAASGRPWNGEQTVQEVYDDNRFELLDTRVCAKALFTSIYWVTDVPITSTNTTYDAEQNRTWSGGNGSKVETRLVSFNANGTVFAAGSATTNTALNSVSVPSNGSLFAQTTLVKDLDNQLRGSACLFSVKFWN